jgi:hypothetical protein
VRIDREGLHLRQSDINDWLQCAEKFRRRIFDEAAGLSRATESDVALAGTTLHKFIEAELGERQVGLDPHAFAYEYYSGEAARFRSDPNVTFTENTFSSDSAAVNEIAKMVGMWLGSPLRADLLGRDPETLLVEWEFDELFTHIDSMPVYLCGTTDLVLIGDGMIDWKTAGRDYQRWEKQRWAVQPTVYTYAAARAGFIGQVPNLPADSGFDSGLTYPFEFVVFPRGRKGGIQHVDVNRGPEHWSWLAQQIGPMVRDIMVGQAQGWGDRWQMNDQSALCSDKWCPFWDSCKGAFMRDGWDK